MSKVMIYLQRTSETQFWDFRTYLNTVYCDSILSSEHASGLVSVTTNFVIERDFRPTTNSRGHVWHAVAELYFRTLADAQRALADPAFSKAIQGDRNRVRLSTVLLGTEFVMHDKNPPDGSVKVMGTFRTSLPELAPMPRPEMDENWRVHAEAMSSAGYHDVMPKWIRTLADFEFHSADPEYDYDGVSSMWFPSVEMAEVILKNEANEATFLPSMEKMGTTNEFSVYLRVQEFSPLNNSTR